MNTTPSMLFSIITATLLFVIVSTTTTSSSSVLSSSSSFHKNGTQTFPSVSFFPQHQQQLQRHQHLNLRNSSYNDACHTHTNCTSCVGSSIFCHWCDYDSSCHAKGSYHGCGIGATCKNNNHDNDDDDNDNKYHDKCSHHSNCTECSLSSNLCHWCAFDEECHAVGSWHGCTHGVNCFNNDRCKRDKPEQIISNRYSNDESETNHSIFLDDIGIVPIFVICFIGFFIVGCSSICFISVRAVKGAYDDWTFVNYSNIVEYQRELDEGDVTDEGNVNPSSHYDINNNDESNENGTDHERYQQHQQPPLADIHEEAEEESDHAVENQDEDQKGQRNNDIESKNIIDENANKHEQDYEITTPLVTQSENHKNDDEEQLANSTTPLVTPHPSLNPSSPSSPSSTTITIPRSSSHMTCFYNTCYVWYIFTIISAIMFVSGSIYFFPKIPEYNVCSDQFAWNSIIDSFTSLKVEASFEVLASIMNRNHLDIVLDDIGGSFRHNGDDVGTFTMKTATIQADSITDVLVTCSVRPDRWEALGLVSDYYRGKLQFMINANGNVKVRGVGYSFPVVIEDFLVNINDPSMDDRHLCHCPEWKDLSPTASPVLPFEDAIEKPTLIERFDSMQMTRVQV